MLRDILTTISLLVIASGAYAGDHELTGKNLIKGDRITVGDLFTNTGRHEKHVLAPTPKVGDKLILSKSDLERVAKAFKLDWHAPENDISVSLQRDAVAVDDKVIIDALASSELKEKIAEDASFQLTNFSRAIVFDGQEMPELAVSNTTFDPVTEQFEATIKISRHNEIAKEFTVKGSATPTISVPVLRNAAYSSNVISEADIVMITVPKRDLRSGTMTSKEELIGMSPKRTLAAKQMVSRSDVTPPILVKRNELITVVYKNGPVSLSTKARALTNGSKGEIVTMQNVTSKKPFEARITGPQQAEVLNDALNG